MGEEQEKKARNYFVLGAIAEQLGMLSEAATNYFKALFAIDDANIFNKTGFEPKDHTERFAMLKANFPELYTITDRLFSTYRRTYTKTLERGEVELVKKRVTEAFIHARIKTPTTEEIKKRLVELSQKRKTAD